MLDAVIPVPSLPDLGPAMPRRRAVAAYFEELRSEVTRHLRMPGFIVPTILFPCTFYGIFFCLLSDGSDPRESVYWLADYATFGAMAPGLYAFGVSVALERENGFLTFKRALPVPNLAYLAAKVGLSMMVAAASAAAVLLLAILTGHETPDLANVAGLVAVSAVGSVPFCGLGLLVGSLVRGQSAASVVNILYMPMAFLSGLLVPLAMLPAPLHVAAALMPGYHLFALVKDAAGLEPTAWAPHVLYLALFALVTGAVAQRRLKVRG